MLLQSLVPRSDSPDSVFSEAYCVNSIPADFSGDDVYSWYSDSGATEHMTDIGSGSLNSKLFMFIVRV